MVAFKLVLLLERRYLPHSPFHRYYLIASRDDNTCLFPVPKPIKPHTFTQANSESSSLNIVLRSFRIAYASSPSA
ncbi:hypothetical protein BC938DRAFT_480417 [Jimgerdemannia flammicorona]|uniref:Uncharacterized protein n=1 Tax=Jimgerdemannia flammicorona TaxID=994334 RepID=A0A433QIM1_9FUNG|nr:hypothetical protein BC938DRAFT_480417 [Jimgerdemannia flammicorona]